MSQVQLRINGRGNAWPVILGQDHPFYDRNNYHDLANASCSILQSKSDCLDKNNIDWELIVDAGHGAVQYLLVNSNRIPDAIILTHSHIDHILGIDWIIQSYYKTYKKPYPVYATGLTWKKTLTAFPQLEDRAKFTELIPFNQIDIKESPGVKLTAYPVYHGQSAEGAAMLFFQIERKQILVTGDVLCPLLRTQDFETLNNLDILIVDANNRLPYPKSNHWSISRGVNNQISEFLKDYIQNISLGTILSPHLKANSSITYSKCFDHYFDKSYSAKDFIFDMISFAEKINPQKIIFMHYSGNEDKQYYNEKILNSSQLKLWAEKEFEALSTETSVIIPYVGQHIKI